MLDGGDGQMEPEVPDADGPAGRAHGQVAAGRRVQARVHALLQVALQLPSIAWG